jgi:broad specificity phosphatase PhoE
MNTTVYLIRHGEVQYKFDDHGQKLLYGTDVSLSDTGRNQLSLIAKKIKRNISAFNRIYSSPLPRAVESAQIVANEFKIKDVLIESRLQDIYVPSSVGLPFEKVIKGELVPLNTSSDETFTDMTKRVWEAFTEILHREKGNNVAIISHGHAIRAIIYLLSNPQVREDIEARLPDIELLQKYDYLNKGESWKLVIGEKEQLISREFITTREGKSSNRERKD